MKKNWLLRILALSFFLLTLSFFLLMGGRERTTLPESSSFSSEREEKKENSSSSKSLPYIGSEAGDETLKEEEAILVHVSGAVLRPGVYALKKGERMKDALQRAGGFLPEAYADPWNLARRLRDGERIHVQTKEEFASSVPPPSEDSKEGETRRIRINTASKEELLKIPGIGSQRADAILKEREKAPFRKAEDLLRVSGIKQGILDKIKEYIQLD